MKIMYRIKLEGGGYYEWYTHDWDTGKVTVLNDITGSLSIHPLQRDQWGYAVHDEVAGVDLSGMTPYAYNTGDPNIPGDYKWHLCCDDWEEVSDYLRSLSGSQ